MTTKKVTTKGDAKGKAEGSNKRRQQAPEEAAAQTARHIAALMEDRRLSARIRAAVADELNDFAALAGGVTGPAVLLASYPAMCKAAGFDGLAATVAAIQRPQPEEVQAAPEFEYYAEEPHDVADRKRLTMPDNTLAHWRIFKYDTVQYEPAGRIKRNRHARQIEAGDLIVLKVKKPREGEPEIVIGEARFEPGKVVLVSHQPGLTRRAFDVRAVLLLGRVEQVWRSIPSRTFHADAE
jgi:hypothetical protein